ncbi:MAG: hypothetical protein RBS73_15625 [Prolixibacteraceae bacterium]|jgi:hypothetical protein|nr:hypothetical protein [Prolixibacteraceae bacterium]
MEDFSITLIWLGFFACIFFGWYFYLKARNKERMALIERNADVSEIFKGREIRFRFPWLKIGMIITGAGFGLLLCVLLMFIPEFENIVERTDGAAVFAIMLFFGGLSIVVAYYLDKPKSR